MSMPHNYPDKGAYMPTQDEIQAEGAKLKAIHIEKRRRASYSCHGERHGSPREVSISQLRAGNLGPDGGR